MKTPKVYSLNTVYVFYSLFSKRKQNLYKALKNNKLKQNL
ncbi:hypothetical protein AsAng_0010000 [Aureispira anguillae]|uniref:Uncharacterized protein n=1 Tax=Aureispira anguillae TaxID=2864201 RepID=A0A915YBZ5_9BACT|nr:hypothetical protein AsAng_0010000 [Aureispira anguillae]